MAEYEKKVAEAETILRSGILSASPVLAFEGGGFMEVEPDYIKKHKPVAGGYYVVYKDGYKSFSPADAFEDGYTRI